MRGELEAWLAPRLAAVEALFATRFTEVWPPAFREPLAYPLATGGKRIRPALCFAACEAVGADWSAATPAPAALELVHPYSLVHDDLPCMDDDDVRRGMPTVHKKWDDATAVLVGDALLTEAFAVLAELGAPAQVGALVRSLARAAGADGMVGGQAADIAGTNGALDVSTVETLQRVHALKTGALIAAATGMGGISGGATPDQIRALDGYGRAVGLAFQLADDVLDADQDAGETGPPSYVRLLGVDETTRRARELADRACRAVAGFPAPQALIALARFSVERTV